MFLFLFVCFLSKPCLSSKGGNSLGLLKQCRSFLSNQRTKISDSQCHLSQDGGISQIAFYSKGKLLLGDLKGNGSVVLFSGPIAVGSFIKPTQLCAPAVLIHCVLIKNLCTF